MGILKKGTIALGLALISLNAYALKVGIIDPQELINKSPQAKASEERIVKEFRPREKKVIEKREELESKIQAYQRDKEILSVKERIKREREITNIRTEFQRMASELQVDIKVKRDEELSAFDREFKNVVNQVAKDDKFDLIFPAQALIYSGDKVDITDKVLDVLKKKFKSKK